MPRPSSRDPSAAPRARPSGPGPTRHLIPWTPPPAQTTAQILWSRSESPDRPGPQAPPPRPRGAPASHSRGPRATKAAAGRAWSRGSGRRPGPHTHLPTLDHTRPRALPPARHPAHPAAAGSGSSPRRRDCRLRPSSYCRSSFLFFLLPEGRARSRGPSGSGAAAQEPGLPAPSAQPGRRGVTWGGAPRPRVRVAPPLFPRTLQQLQPG